MTVYLRKQTINTSLTEKIEVYNFTVYPFPDAKEIKTRKEPEWWRTFDTEQEALNHLKS